MKTSPLTPRMSLCLLTIILATILNLPTHSWAAESLSLNPLRAEMRAEHYDKAISMADKIIAAKDPKADEAHYLKALALFHAKKYAEAVGSADHLTDAFPQSEWRFKATFLKAQSLVEQKQFEQAADIYQTEAARLLAADRKQELAGVIVTFADILTKKPDKNVPDAPKPDFQKAYKLYSKSLSMEISRDFRDDLVFKKARAIQQAGNSSQAVKDFQAYLVEFDPGWTGPAGSGKPRLPMQVPPPAGKHIAMARYHLAESQIQAGNPAAGRMELEDLLKLISAPVDLILPIKAELATDEGIKLPAEIRWLMVQSFIAPANTRNLASNARIITQANFVSNNASSAQFIGNTGGLSTDNNMLYTVRNDDLDSAIKACRDFLAAFPEGSRAVRVAWMIAEANQNAGRADDALEAYRDFIVGKGFRLPEGKASQEFDEELRAAPITHLTNLKMRAVFRIGTILRQQKKYEDAIVAWSSYVKDYPDGPQWSESQNAIIDAEFQMGMAALADEDESLALQRFEEFLQAHPLDKRAPRVLYIFGAVHEAKAKTLEEAKGDKAGIDSSYLKAIDEWAKLVSKYPDSPEARTALMKSGAIYEEKFGDFEKALHLYRKLVSDFGYGQANSSIARLTQKSLDMSVERTFRTNEKAVVKLKLRNIEKCTFRLHKIDLQSYFRKMHGITGVEGLDVSLIQPDKTWEFTPEDYTKYKPYEQEVEIPFPGNEPGAYVVIAGDDDWESTVLVLRSDLEVIVKSSRREVLAFVQNMLTGKPARDVDILVSDGKAIAATGKTGKDGVFKATVESLKDLSNVSLFALSDDHAASFNLNLSGLQLSSGLTAKGYLYTDRHAYLPGETVSLRGILREVRNTAYAVPENSEFKISVTDPQGRLLSEETVEVSRFGTFDSSLVLPGTAVNGRYVIAAHQDRKGQNPLHFQGSFEVRSFKLEKIKLAMEFPRRVWFRGEIIEATLQAGFYWGEPLGERMLRCTLPNGRTQTITTDAEGKAKLTFDTTGMRPGSALTFTASLDGENVATSETVTLARLGFSITSKPSQPAVISGEPFDLALTTTDADGKPTGQTLKVSVLRLDRTKSSPVLSLLPWKTGFGSQAAEVKDSESEIKTDSTTGKATLSLQLEKGGRYRLRTTGTDRFGQTITHQCQVEVSDESDATKLRLFAETSTLKVGSDTAVRLHSRLEKGLALVTFEGETILAHRIIELKKDYNEIPVEVGHELFPNFRLAVAAMDGRELRSAQKDFSVERELKVVVKPMKESFLPGEEGKVEITVTDQNGEPVDAELSLALVNEALFSVIPDKLTSILDFFQKDARRFAKFNVGATCGFSYQGRTRPVSKDIVAEGKRMEREELEQREIHALRQQRAASAPQPQARVQTSSSARSSRGGYGGGAFFAFDAEESGVPILGDLPITGELFQKSRELKSSLRSEVRSEGRWLPSIITDANGKAVVTVPMPETTTAWRLTARGCSVETLVGQATAKTLTRKDFFVELKTPSFIREGDQLRAVGRVHNLTDYAGPVALKLRILDTSDKTKVLAEYEEIVEVKAKAGAEVAFDAVTIPASLEITTELTGVAGSNSDALAMEIPVKPWGLQYSANAGGTADSDTAAVVGLSGDRAYSSLWMSVAIGPDVRTSVLDMALRRVWIGPCGDMARLKRPAWGDTQANDLLAAVTALRYANTGKVDETYTQQLSTRARTLVASLVASQAKDGNWNSESLRHLTTARVFWALIEARNSGIVVNKDTIEKAAAALLKQFEACDINDNDSKAVILHALSTDKRADYANCNRLYRERNVLGNFALAHTARAFYNLDRREIATELATMLEGKVNLDADKPVLWEGGCKITWLNDTDETTAMVLLALAETKPSSTVASAAADSLLQAHGCFGFRYPRAQGPAVAALSAWFALGVQQTTDLAVDVVVNGKEIGTVKTVAALGQHYLPVPVDLVKADKNLVQFKMSGRGRYTYAATLFGFSSDMEPTTKVYPRMDRVKHLHAPLEYRGKAISANSTSPVKNLENGQRVHVVLNRNKDTRYPNRRFVLEIAMPPGARLDENTLKGNRITHREIIDSTITLFYDEYLNDVSFDLTGYVPGTFRMLPPVIREIGNPAFMAVGPTTEITVLAAGEKSPDDYKMNIAEHYALGKCYFDDGDLDTALEHLSAVYGENPKYNERDLAKMLLWIHTDSKFYNAQKIVNMFEILRERYPQLEIPYDKILVVGKAYADIREFERSWLVYRAAIAASFNNDSSISAVLEDEGRFLGSLDYLERIWHEYPDTADVVTSYLALSQLLYEKAPNAHKLPKEDGVQPEKIAMLKRTADYLVSFLAMYPQDPLADDAAFSLANCVLTLKNYPLVVALGNEFAEKYPDSTFAPGFQYITALGLFWQHEYDDALAAARVVADGDSKDRDYARYILGQIYHAESKPKDAIEWYSRVKDLYPDAAEAITYFEKKSIALDEVTIFEPGEKVELTLKYRNIKEASLQIYRVDLMKLYLQQKNLSAITSVQLAGIKPELENEIKLGDGKDYAEKEYKVPLKQLRDEAAYLVICRGDDLFTSGMILVTPLKIEAQEDAASGRVRANVLDTVKGGYRPEVHVKAIGSADTEFRSGETDLRGLFIADNVRGKATVIAREGESRYAFFRGQTWLGAPQNAPAGTAQPRAKQQQEIDFLHNMEGMNTLIQFDNNASFNEQRRGNINKGVQVQKAQ